MQCLSSLDDNENATPFTHTPVELCSSVDIVTKDKGRRARVVVKRQTSSCGVTSHLTLPRALCAALRFRIPPSLLIILNGIFSYNRGLPSLRSDITRALLILQGIATRGLLILKGLLRWGGGG
jgi:hypothetical protein